MKTKQITKEEKEELKEKAQKFVEESKKVMSGSKKNEDGVAWHSQQLRRWTNYGKDRLYFVSGEDSYINLKTGEVVIKENLLENIIEYENHIVVTIQPVTEHDPVAVIPKEGI